MIMTALNAHSVHVLGRIDLFADLQCYGTKLLLNIIIRLRDVV